MSRSRWRRRLAVASLVVAALLAVLAGAAWLLRDLPRREVEAGLANRLGARVAVGGFRAEGTRRFVLNNLVVTRLAGQNRLRRLSIGTLVVEGPATGLLEGRFDLLEAFAVEVRLGPPDPSIPQPTGPAAEVRAGRFRLTDARVVLEGAGSEAQAAVEADLEGIGGDMAGKVRLTADHLPLAALLAVAGAEGGAIGGDLRSIAATAEFAKGGSGIALRARAAQAALEREGRSIPILHPELAAELSPSDDGERLAFDARATASGIEEAGLRGTLDEKTGRLVEADGAVRGLEIETWLPLVPGLPAGIDAEGRLDATAASSPGSPLRWTVHAAIDHVEAPAGAGPADRVRAEGVTIALEGELDAARPKAGGPLKASVTLPSIRGSVSGIAIPETLAPATLEFDGRATAEDAPDVAGKIVFLNGITGRLDADLDGAVREGVVTAAARWRLAPTDFRPLLDLATSIGVPLPANLTMVGTLSADGEGTWPPSRGAMLVARVKLERLAAAVGATVALKGAHLSAAIAWPSPGAPIAVGGLDLEGTLDAPPVPSAPIRIAGRALVVPSPPAIRDAAIDVASPGLFQIAATGAWSSSTGGTFGLRLAQADLPRWQSFLEPVLGEVAPGYSVQGKASADLSGTVAADMTWTGRGTAAITKSGFASGDGARVLEGLDTTWDVTVAGQALSRGSAHATARVEGFQVLWDSFFADYAALPSSMVVDAAFGAGGEGPAWRAGLSWSYPDGPALDVKASGDEGGAVAFDADFAVASLEKTLSKYLRAPLGDSVPWFDKIEGEGTLRVRAKGSLGGDAFGIAGRVRLEDARIEGTKGFVEVGGLDLDLPFDLTWSARDAKGERALSGPPLSGTLSFEKFEAGGMALAATSTPLRIEADTIALDEGLAVPLLGGTLGFEKLTLIDALRPTRRAETAVFLWSLSLREASEAFGLPALDGEADGYFPAVKLEGSSFEVKGGGEISVFGGKLKIGGISGEDVLTRFPKMRLSADFESIDLAKVTGTFDFGDMTGIVRGYVHDVELFRGVPTRFDARIETVETKGVHNTLNVKAINNIAILGTGGNVGILDRGIHKFIDEFTYGRIGIELKLSNDVFVMHGLERRGSEELFVKGRLPFPINVVNAQPGRTVSFRSMLERLKAVDFAGATTKGKK